MEASLKLMVSYLNYCCILYKNIEFKLDLDTGESAAYEDLMNASKKYWDDWRNETN